MGCWVFQNETIPGICGYLYRYLGNGGMGMSFMVLVTTFGFKKNLIPIGIAYGLFICVSLILTLLVSPNGEAMMFELTLLNCFGSIIGHVIYGLVLGYMTRWSLKRSS